MKLCRAFGGMFYDDFRHFCLPFLIFLSICLPFASEGGRQHVEN